MRPVKKIIMTNSDYPGYSHLPGNLEELHRQQGDISKLDEITQPNPLLEAIEILQARLFEEGFQDGEESPEEEIG